MEIKQNDRGFQIGHFVDTHKNGCSIQQSSDAMQECIWVGIDHPRLTVFENHHHGNYIVTEMPENFMVNSRMHLSREQVAELLPHLQKFVETGYL